MAVIHLALQSFDCTKAVLWLYSACMYVWICKTHMIRTSRDGGDDEDADEGRPETCLGGLEYNGQDEDDLARKFMTNLNI